MNRMSWVAIVGLGFLFLECGPRAEAAGWTCFSWQGAVWGQAAGDKGKSGDEKGTTDADALKKLLERINKLEAEVERLKANPGGQPAAPEGTPQVLTFVEHAHLMPIYLNGNSRLAAVRLSFANTTGAAITLKREQVSAEVDGEARKIEPLPENFRQYSFQIQFKNQSYNINDLQMPENLRIPPNGQVSTWLVFAKLPAAGAIPKIKLTFPLGEVKKVIDVNQSQRALLGLETEKIGPRGCLGLVTISGTMTPFNTQGLVDELESLAAQKIVRAVVRFGPDAPQPDQNLVNWLMNAAMTFGQVRNTNEMFPPIPNSLREFHVVKFSDTDSTTYGGYRAIPGGVERVHRTPIDAIGAALKSAYQALPREELLQEIREGHPQTRAAALTYGGGRLGTEHLPQVLQWVEDSDARIQKAALQTLAHFGEPEAVEKLVAHAKRGAEPLATGAIESLAGSRFGTAHEALLTLLKNEPPESKKKIVQVLARFPRPIWSETLYEFVNDSREGLNLEAMKALVQVDHPKLVDVLETGLSQKDKPLRDYCFQILSGRSDDRSEKLALKHALAVLKDSPPDGTMMAFLSRVKDPQIPPLLLAQLNKDQNTRQQVLATLVQIGDASVLDKLLEIYPSLQTFEKTTILGSLRVFRNDKLRELAGTAAASSDQQLVSQGANALQQEGHADGEKLLIAALEKHSNSTLTMFVANALSNYGTPTAKSALIKASQTGDDSRRAQIANALTNLRNRSPGGQQVQLGRQLAAQKQYKQALDAFKSAIELEPELAEAYAGRGKAYLQENKLEEAGKDFEKALALKLEPLDNEVITGLALARTIDGKLDEAIKLVEDHRPKVADATKKNRVINVNPFNANVAAKDLEALFLYNVACVYSRSVQYLKEHPDVADRDKKREQYRKQSLTDLEQAIKLGFADFDWMEKDPDFTVLREDAEFKTLLSKRPAKKPNDLQKTPDEEQ